MCHWAIHKKIPKLAIQKVMAKSPLRFPPIFLQGQNWWKAILKSSEMPGACVPGIPKKCHDLIDELTCEKCFRPLNTSDTGEIDQHGFLQNQYEPKHKQQRNWQFRIKTPWSMSSTDPNHVLTCERLSGEKMVVLLAVKEELSKWYWSSDWYP